MVSANHASSNPGLDAINPVTTSTNLEFFGGVFTCKPIIDLLLIQDWRTLKATNAETTLIGDFNVDIDKKNLAEDQIFLHYQRF